MGQKSRGYRLELPCPWLCKLGKNSEMDGIVESKGRYGSGESRPVKDTEMFLGLQSNGFDIVVCEGFL
jgi:hypothetical protein